MKIVLVNNYGYAKGGAETAVKNISTLLTINGHEVILLEMKNLDLQNQRNILVEKIGKYIGSLYNFKAAKKIEEIILAEKPDIVHIHNIIGGISFSILRIVKKYSIPLIMTVHDFRLLCPVYVFLDKNGHICEKCKFGNYLYCTVKNCSEDGIIKSVFLTIESFIRNYFLNYKKRIDALIFVSEFSKKKFLETDLNLASKSYRLYNFTDAFIRNSTHKGYFLFFGRLSREKGLISLVNVFRRIPEIKLVIAGTGELYDEIMKKKSENIDMVGYKTGRELIDLISNAYFIIVSSECYENNPLSIVESLSLGKPVIGSNIGGIPELIIDGYNGFIFDLDNNDSLYRVITNASSIDEGKYKVLSENAYEFAKNNFQKDIIYKEIIKIYKKILKKKEL